MEQKVAVIIVNWNSGDWIAKSVRSVLLQTRPADKIVVVDNASTDGSITTLDEIAAPNLEVVRLDKNMGFAAANNVGIERSDGCGWIALLNSDALADADWLRALMARAGNHADYQFFACRQVMVTAPRYLDGAGDVYHVSGSHWRSAYGQPVARRQEPCEVFAACGAAALYRADAIKEVGGFSESYFCYAEDVDLGFRLRLRGYRCLYVPDAVVHHVGSAITGQRSEFTVYHGHRNLVWTYFKNMPGPLFWLYLPQHLFLNLVSVVWFAWRGQARVILKAKWDAILGLPRILRERRRVQQSRRVGAWEVRRVMAKGWLAPYLQYRRRQV